MNNGYKKAMDKIRLSDELRERIIADTVKVPKNQSPKFRSIYIKQIAGIAACLMLCFISYFAVSNRFEGRAPVDTVKKSTETVKSADETPENNSSEENELPPFVNGKIPADAESKVLTAGEISKKLGYEIEYPHKLPEGYTLSVSHITEESIVEMKYKCPDDIITYRTAQTQSDLSLRNGVYENSETVSIDGSDAVLESVGELYFNASWLRGEYSFSITSNNGVERQDMIDMILSVGSA